MRKILFLALTLLTVLSATLTLPKAEASTTCNWTCGLCGTVCLCRYCSGPLPVCPCG